VCVLGHDTAQELFVNGENPIGKEVNVATGLYTVIGVLDKQKQPFGSGKNAEDNAIYFPMGTFHSLHPEVKDMSISVKYDDPSSKSLVEEEIREVLRVRRKVNVTADDNFSIFGPDSLTKLWSQLTGGLVAFMIAVTQFTTEAVTLCAIGGIVGVLVGAAITWIVYLLPIGLPASLSTLWVLVGFGVSCAIGLLFGIYPAWKAANLDPIEALRYE
jgi:putative ABC transport system permease protein